MPPVNRSRLGQVVLDELVKEVKKRAFMWDPENLRYNDRTMIGVAWRQIAATMNKPEDILRSKWKNLRDLFRKELKKTKVTSLKDYRGKWRYFRILWFLYRPDEVYVDEAPLEETECIVKREPDPEFDYLEINENQLIEQEGTRRHSEEDSPSNNKRLKNEDECYESNYDMLFLKSLLPFFEALSPVRKLVVRNEIQKILINELKQNEDNILGVL